MKNTFVKKTFYAMLIPTILMNLVTCISTATDTIIVGNFIGEDALAAVTFSLPIFMIINTIASLIAVGGSTALGNALGRGDKDRADEIFSSAMILSIFISVLFAFLGALFIDPIVALLGAEGAIADLTREYTIIILAMTPVFLLNLCLAFFIRTDGRPTLAMAAMLTSIAVDVVLGLLFVVIFKWGMVGAAWATVLSQAVSALIMLTHFFSKKNTLRLVMKRVVSKFGLIFKSGTGTSLQFVYQFIVILVFNHLIMRTAGSDGIVVFTVVINVLTIAMSIFEGLSQTVQPMFSVYYGENNHSAMKATMKYAMMMTFLLGGAVTLLLVFFPHVLVRMFGVVEPGLATSSVLAIQLFSASIIIMTVNVIMSYYYQSTERAGFASVIVAAHNLVFLLAGALLLGSLFGINGIWGAYLFAQVLTIALWFVYAILKGRRDKSGILLLPSEGKVYSRFTSGGEDIADEVIAFLTENGVGVETHNHTISVINEHAKGGSIRAEVRIAVGEEVSLIIRDDGALLDESLFEPFKQTAKSLEYGAVLGLNRMLAKY
jgi:putative MATE family efflux protein